MPTYKTPTGEISQTCPLSLEEAQRWVEESIARTRELQIQRNLIAMEAQRKRESEAGDPQVGDLVVCRQPYGELKRGQMGIVTDRRIDDIGGTVLELELGGCTGVCVVLRAVMKCECPASLLTDYMTAAEKLQNEVFRVTGIRPEL